MRTVDERPWELMIHDADVRTTAGVRLLAGVDEVGRGALAGPLVAAAVILPDRLVIPGVDDSKTVSAGKRLQVARRVTRVALSWAVAFVSAREIDHHGLQEANLAAMCAAVAGLRLTPELVLSDWYRLGGLTVRSLAVKRGDSVSQSIAAASCLAKVVRDGWMRHLGEGLYPGYGWERNVGYGTREHLAAVAAMGLTTEHRRRFIQGKGRSTATIARQEALPFLPNPSR